MKLITQWRFILLYALFSLLGVGSAWAQFNDGGVYNFKNASKNQSMTITDSDYLNVTTTNLDDNKQLWEADEVSTGVFTLRNLSNGKYLKSPNSSYNAYWTTVDAVDESCKFSCTAVGDGSYTMRATNATSDYHYLYYGNEKIQCWSAGMTASRWFITEKIIYNETDVPGALRNLFSDAACTTLKKQFANEAALIADIDYLTLPEALRNMVKKVYSQTWTENNYDGTKLAWDSEYAQKYRVQLYEPYNDIMNASEALNINWHTNLNNPTGIFANNGDVLYVMVEGEIKEGASLYLDYFVDGERLSTNLNHGTPLQPGLNIITCTADKSNYCINYVVEVFDTTDGKRGHKAKKRALTEYSPLKIHIEGGYLNGYWNKMGDALYPADENDNWEYLEARANQKELLVLGQYVTLQFPLKDADTKGNKGLGSYLNDQVLVEDVIREWDNIMKWERMLLGLLHEDVSNAAAPKSPYSEHDHVIEYTGNDSDFPSGYGNYYNIHGLAWGVDHNTMYATGDYSAYHYATMNGVIKSIPTDAGSHWGPAHEMGHQHQNLINMRGEMEGSNNLFSNVVLWVHGELTSRVNGTEGSLEAVLKNFNNESGHYLSNSIWGMSQMYYKFFLYYHVLGHNPKFYPRLFEMLRQDPQRDNNAGVIDGANAQLHLYKKVCEAAGEDLTEFFRAHGFFKPLNNAFVDDSYNVSVFNMSQKQIDAAIAEVKEQAKTKGWKVNTAVLFINDATGENILSHKDGVEHLTLNPETTICAQVGNYSNFNNTTANYSYSLSGTTVTMNGTGGVGFAVFNEKGEIMAFSNKKSFEISAAAASAIAAGKATIEIVKGDNTTHVATSIMDADNTAEKYQVLGQTLHAAKAILDFTDNNNKKVGYYKTDKLTQLQTAYNQAKTVYDEKNAGAYAAVYELLYKEYTKVLADEYARVNIVDGYVYRLVNRAYNNLSMAVDNNDAMLGAETNEADDKQLWYLETASATNTYYLKNKKTTKYPGNVENGEELSADKATKSQAYAYRLEKIEDGVFAFVGGDGLHCSQTQGYKIVGWGADSKATQWYITAVETNATVETRLELEALAAKTKALIDEMAVATGIEEYDMSACTVTSNTPETGHGTELLTDGDPETFFHTNWQGTPTNEEHNLVFDLGENHNLEYFVINYTTLPTTAYNVDAPKTIVVEGSNDKSSYTEIATLSGLPETMATNYTSNALEGGYRYLRLKVTDATGNKLGDFYYFGLAELSFTQLCPIVKEVYTPYTALETDIISAAELCGRANFIVTKVETNINTINEAKTALQLKYEALLEAYNTICNGDVNAKRVQLAALITAAEELMGTCGTINSTPGVTIDAALQTENPAAGFYVSTNADQNTGGGAPDGGGIAALVDGSVEGDNYFHTRWSGTEIHEAHYIQIDLGEGVPTAGFTFSYTPRDPSPAPTAMKVYGSHDGIEFSNVLAHITSGLPAYNSGLTYTSETIPSGYRHLRFVVTESQGPAASSQYGGQYYFGMYEFDLSYLTPTTYSATVNPNMGEVTEELLLNVFHKLAEAQGTLDYATTEAQLDKAIADLQAQYDALEAAKTVVDKSELASLIETATTRLGECGTVTPNGDVLDVTLNEQAGSVNKNMLRELYRAIEDAQGVIANTKATQVDVDAEIAELTAQIEVVQTAKNSTAKADLKTAIDAAQNDINACASSITQEGGEYTVVWKFETAGDVDKATLIAAYEALVQANTIYNGEASTVSEYQAAKEALGTPIATLNEYKAGYHKKQLNTFVGWAETLLEECETEGQGDLTDAMVVSITERCVTVRGYLTQEFATHEELVNTLSPQISYFEENYSTWTAAQQSTAKAELRTMIAELAELIGECGTVTEEESEYVATLDPYAGVVTEEQLIAAYRAKVDAETLANNSAVATDLTAKKEALQDVYNNLLTAKDTNWLPVTLTKDINSPVLYTFKSARGANKVMQYDPAESHSFSIATATDGAVKQAFFFMMGDTRNQVYIYPYAGAGMVLGADNTDNGANKVFAGEKGTQDYKQWTFVEQGDWYNLQPVGTSTYLSNIYGVSYKMGFYSSDPDTDNGSRFQFEEVEIEGSSAYNSLKVYYQELVKHAHSNVIAEDRVGGYSEDKATTYNNAYASATTALESIDKENAVYETAYDALKTANEGLVVTQPEPGKFYTIKSVSTSDYCRGKFVHTIPTSVFRENATWGDKTYDHRHLIYSDIEDVDPTALWQFTDDMKMQNVHTGEYVKSFDKNAQHMGGFEEAATITIGWLAEGQSLLKIGNNSPMHAQNDYQVIVTWSAEKDNASAWAIEEADMSNVAYSTTISKYGLAGLYLNYPVKVPDGVNAYYVSMAEGAGGIAKLTKIENRIIPANEGVILEGTENATISLPYVSGDVAAISENLLKGSNYTGYIQGEDNTKYYLFGAKSGKVGLYWTYLQYNADGTINEANTDNGGYFKCSANKVYLPYSEGSGVAKFSFRFDDTTGIDDLLNGLNGEQLIYDLQGRRILKVTESGIYIVNGEKRYIHAK